MATKKTKEEKTISGLSFKGEVILVYILGVVGFVFAIMKNKDVSKKVQFHYNQAGTCWLVSLVLGALNRSILSGYDYYTFCYEAISIVLFVFVIITIVRAYKGTDETYKIPGVSVLSEKIFGKTI